LPEGQPLLDEVIRLEASWESPAHGPHRLRAAPLPRAALSAERPSCAVDPTERCRELALCWEPDFLLLRPGDDQAMRLVGGSVCFSSWWALREKLGRPLPEIHHPVPGLNEALAQPIQTFLARLTPGISWERENWGLSRTPELNLHPRRNMPRLIPPLQPEEVWLRVEHQSFVALPNSRGLLFGIRLKIHPLLALVKDRGVAAGLRRALETMPEAVARYKGLAEARAHLVQLLS
jgi:hypothetical protein